MARLLLENGADIHACTETGDSVFHIALESTRISVWDRIWNDHDEGLRDQQALEIAELLVGYYGCDPLRANSSGKTSFHIAIELGHISVARYLLSLGIPLPPDILLATLDPGEWKTAEMIYLLAENGADIHSARTKTGDTMFHITLQSFDEDEILVIAKLLVDSYGCDPRVTGANSFGKTSIHIAIERGHISVVRYLLSLGVALPPDIFVTLDTWSRWTAGMVRLLLENGADVHAHTETGDSVFHLALHSYTKEHEALEIAKILVGYGCNPCETNSSGKTSLHSAIEWGHISVAQYLLSLRVPLPPDVLLTSGMQNDMRVVPQLEVFRFLVKNGANVLARNTLGDSVLHVVLETLPAQRVYDRPELGVKTIEFLVAHGCDPFEANSRGETPLRIAVKHRLGFVECYLRSLGACDLRIMPLPHVLDAGRKWIYLYRSFCCLVAS